MILRCADNLDEEDETHKVGFVIDYGYNSLRNENNANVSNSSNQTNHQFNPPQQGTSYAGGKAYQANDFRANYNNDNKQPALRYCHYWAKGNCTRENCRYLHQHDPSKKDKRHSSQPKSVNTYGPKSDHTKPPEKAQVEKLNQFIVNLNQAQLDFVGQPAGLVSEGNANGYSIKQRALIRKIMTSQPSSDVIPPTPMKETINSLSFASWGDKNVAPYADRFQQHEHLKHIHLSYSQILTIKNKKQDPTINNGRKDYTKNKVQLVEESKVINTYFLQNLTHPKRALPIERRIINTAMLQIELYYTQHGFPASYSRYEINDSIIVSRYIHNKKIKVNKTLDLVDHLQLFLWHPLEHGLHNRRDIRLASKEWMKLMYQIGHCLLQACICIDGMRPSGQDDMYMRFNPHDKVYRQSGTYGSYWSQMTCVAENVKINDLLQELLAYNSVINNTLYIDTATHALVFDFMAFTSQTIGYYRDHDELTINMLREGLRKDIIAFSNLRFSDAGLRQVFLTVVYWSRPIKDPIKRALPSHITDAVDEYRSRAEATVRENMRYNALHPRSPNPELPDPVLDGMVFGKKRPYVQLTTFDSDSEEEDPNAKWNRSCSTLR